MTEPKRPAGSPPGSSENRPSTRRGFRGAPDVEVFVPRRSRPDDGANVTGVTSGSEEVVRPAKIASGQFAGGEGREKQQFAGSQHESRQGRGGQARVSRRSQDQVQWQDDERQTAPSPNEPVHQPEVRVEMDRSVSHAAPSRQRPTVANVSFPRRSHAVQEPVAPRRPRQDEPPADVQATGPSRGEPARPTTNGWGRTTARTLAAEVLTRVERDRAFAAAVLDAELDRATGLSPRDRALATELVYGSLRTLPLLEQVITAATPRGIDALDPRIRATLIVAAYQLHYTRVPAFAAVSEAVDAVRNLRGRTMSGFANGVLRRVAQEAKTAPLPEAPRAYLDATAPWLRRALERSLGQDAMEAMLMAGPFPPPTGIRTKPGQRDLLLGQLQAAYPDGVFSASKWSDVGILSQRIGDPHQLPGFAEGRIAVQEEGSQVVAALLEAEPHHVVLDACAGRGNKAIYLAERLDPGNLHVADLHPDKLARLMLEVARSHEAEPTSYAVDWSVGLGDVPIALFDRVLVDAPCTGTGTLRRRPEIQTRRSAHQLVEVAALQASIVTMASKAVKPGGVLLYAICSVLRDEAELVVSKVLETCPELSASPFEGELASRLFGPNSTSGRLLPHVHGTDGYFVARFSRITGNPAE